MVGYIYLTGHDGVGQDYSKAAEAFGKINSGDPKTIQRAKEFVALANALENGVQHPVLSKEAKLIFNLIDTNHHTEASERLQDDILSFEMLAESFE